MKCPVCNIDLLMAERQGIGIDYCPTCRGIWLDRGKLEQLLDNSIQIQNQNNVRNYSKDKYLEHYENNQERHHYDDDDDDDHRYYEKDKHHDDRNEVDKYGRRRKRGFFDFLDFGD
jgi:uncharacterized protein